MKRILALILTVVLALGCFSVAFAEDRNGGRMPQGNVGGQQPGGNAGGQQPQPGGTMGGQQPGGNAGGQQPGGNMGGQQPGMPSGDGAQMPEMPEGMPEDMPEDMPGMPENSFNEENWKTLVDSGIISQETFDAIVEYVAGHYTDDMTTPEGETEVPEKPEGETEVPEKPEGETEVPEKPEGEEDGEVPEKPEGEEDGEVPEKPEENDAEQPEKPETGMMFSRALLDELLEEGIITQTEYDAIIALQGTETTENTEDA